MEVEPLQTEEAETIRDSYATFPHSILVPKDRQMTYGHQDLRRRRAKLERQETNNSDNGGSSPTKRRKVSLFDKPDTRKVHFGEREDLNVEII